MTRYTHQDIREESARCLLVDMTYYTVPHSLTRSAASSAASLTRGDIVPMAFYKFMVLVSI
jgi:hypothetical protein